jgi:uncharacterized protein (TIGR02186 family)
MRIFLLLLLLITPLNAEKLIPSLSTHRVLINSTFSGTDIVLYGLIEQEANSAARTIPYDIVAVVKGEEKSVVMRERIKSYGFWVNGEALVLPPTPSALVTMSNRPLRNIANQETLKKFNVGQHTILAPLGDDKFRLAFLRLQNKNNNYRNLNTSVVFLTPNWFRGRLPLPASMPTGQYSVELLLFSGGTMVTQTQTNFEIIKVGTEQIISRQAQMRPFLYGLGVVLTALLLGALAFLVFRKD